MKKRWVIVSFALILIIFLSIFVSAGFFSNLFDKLGITGKVVDTTNRVSFFPGKVNQHTENGVWMTDPDGSSGAAIGNTELGRMAYCKKFYGDEIISSPEYQVETIDFCIAGNVDCTFTFDKQTYECTGGTSSSSSESSPNNCKSCVDSTHGWCQDSNPTGDNPFTEPCLISAQYGEYYCTTYLNTGTYIINIADCPIEDPSVGPEIITSTDCTDTDEGLDYFKPGKTYLSEGLNKILINITSYEDTLFFVEDSSQNPILRQIALESFDSEGISSLIDFANEETVIVENNIADFEEFQLEISEYSYSGSEHLSFFLKINPGWKIYSGGIDFCSDNELIEFTCSESGSLNYSYYECPFGCFEGACRSSLKEIEFEYFLENGNPEDKLDILFIPFNITEDSFEDVVNEMLYSKGKERSNSCGNIMSRGLFEVEPFKSNKEKINIEISKEPLDFEYYVCKYSDAGAFRSKPFLNCEWDLLKQSFSQEIDITVIVGKDFAINAPENIIVMGDPEASSVDSDASYSDSFVHEFGHAFGGLTDEYGHSLVKKCNEEGCSYASSLPDPCVNSKDPSCFERTEKEIKVIPNEDTLGCPKWCEDYNENSLEFQLTYLFCTEVDNMKDCLESDWSCLWFNQEHPWFNSNCIPSYLEDIGVDCTCELNRHYQHLSFSPACEEGGMMNNLVGDFNDVSKEHLEDVLGCCFPANDSLECKEFSEKFNLSEDVNPYFRFAYDKFAECYDYSTCSDSDNGLNYSVKGSVEGVFQEEDYLFSDSCINQGTLLEYSCEENTPSNVTHICLDRCSKGACIKTRRFFQRIRCFFSSC